MTIEKEKHRLECIPFWPNKKGFNLIKQADSVYDFENSLKLSA